MRLFLKMLFLLFVSPMEWRDIGGFFRSKESEARRGRRIRAGYLTDLGDNDPFQ
jgi:hypothetical protein